MKLKDIKPNPDNPRVIKDEKYKKLKKSIEEFPAMLELRPLVIDENNVILGGNMRYRVLQELGIKDVKVVRAKLTEEQKKEFIIKDNLNYGEWDWDMLLNEWDAELLTDWGLDLLIDEELGAKAWGVEDKEEYYANNDGDGINEKVGYNLGSLWYGMTKNNEVYPYMLPLPTNPNAKDGATVKLNYSRTNPTSTERIVKTYMREGDKFFEMCCGWMTFSSTAKYFGYSGKGGDIWDVSLDFCKKQLDGMPGKGEVEVIYADARDTKEPSEHYDFVHSNPPFFNLETYSDSEKDLAKGSYERWLDAMADMGAEAERILKNGGLANFVINDFRKDGVLIPMHLDFINAIQRKTKLKLHDFVVSEVVSQALRFRKHDYERRRTVKCHEYIITFKKI